MEFNYSPPPTATEFDLISEIEKQTEQKTPGINEPNIAMNNSDFDKKPVEVVEAQQSQIQQQAVEPVKKQLLSPDLTAEIAVESIDAIQSTVFLALNARKLKKRLFADSAEYKLACNASYLSEEEILKQENADYVRTLQRKYNDYNKRLKQLDKSIEYSEEEKTRMRKPVTEWVKKSGFDLPPGLAFILVFSELTTDRVIDLIMD